MRVTDTFDFVVVGAGSGGCTVAGRLSEDPAISVAVLDAGGRNDNWVVTTPFALVLMVAGNVNNWAFNTVPQKGLNGRIGYQPRGKGLGGSSAINAMVYIRGHRTAITTNGHRSAMPAGRSPMCCPTSSARKTMPISAANITARAAHSPSTSCGPRTRYSRSSCKPPRKRR
jgi:choline dehydrogenase-like flavoprotein